MVHQRNVIFKGQGIDTPTDEPVMCTMLDTSTHRAGFPSHISCGCVCRSKRENVLLAATMMPLRPPAAPRMVTATPSTMQIQEAQKLKLITFGFLSTSQMTEGILQQQPECSTPLPPEPISVLVGGT